MEEIEKLMDEEIKSQIEDISGMDTGSKEKSEAIDDLAKLYRLRLERDKAVWEQEEKENRRLNDDMHRDDEAELEKLRLSDEKKNRWAQFGLSLGGIVLPLIFYDRWWSKGLMFEKEGTFGSTIFRELRQKFRPTK